MFPLMIEIVLSTPRLSPQQKLKDLCCLHRISYKKILRKYFGDMSGYCPIYAVNDGLSRLSLCWCRTCNNRSGQLGSLLQKPPDDSVHGFIVSES